MKKLVVTELTFLFLFAICFISFADEAAVEMPTIGYKAELMYPGFEYNNTPSDNKVEIENVYSTIPVSDDEKYMLVCNAWWACAEDACNDETVYAVFETVLNRYLAGKWGNSVANIVSQYNQFEYGTFKSCRSLPKRCSQETIEKYYTILNDLLANGPKVLPSTNYQFYATKKQSLGKNHIWIGLYTKQGNPSKGHGMYFCEGR